jgi:hypothetical protein
MVKELPSETQAQDREFRKNLEERILRRRSGSNSMYNGPSMTMASL